jgi:hypothetical protein
MTISVGGFAVSYGVYSGVLYDSYQYCMIMVVERRMFSARGRYGQAANIPTQNGKCNSVII